MCCSLSHYLWGTQPSLLSLSHYLFLSLSLSEGWSIYVTISPSPTPLLYGHHFASFIFFSPSRYRTSLSSCVWEIIQTVILTPSFFSILSHVSSFLPFIYFSFFSSSSSFCLIFVYIYIFFFFVSFSYVRKYHQHYIELPESHEMNRSTKLNQNEPNWTNRTNQPNRPKQAKDWTKQARPKDQTKLTETNELVDPTQTSSPKQTQTAEPNKLT